MTWNGKIQLVGSSNKYQELQGISFVFSVPFLPNHIKLRVSTGVKQGAAWETATPAGNWGSLLSRDNAAGAPALISCFLSVCSGFLKSGHAVRLRRVALRPDSAASPPGRSSHKSSISRSAAECCWRHRQEEKPSTAACWASESGTKRLADSRGGRKEEENRNAVNNYSCISQLQCQHWATQRKSKATFPKYQHANRGIKPLKLGKHWFSSSGNASSPQNTDQHSIRQFVCLKLNSLKLVCPITQKSNTCRLKAFSKHPIYIWKVRFQADPEIGVAFKDPHWFTTASLCSFPEAAKS